MWKIKAGLDAAPCNAIARAPSSSMSGLLAASCIA
ncbi:Uncharacterised protein [Mycobacteroides abscessus subsp. abscessus]|nr:Uncharacterised protein [Mycobacteroides abscessus subsp. abscessus]